MRDRRRRAGRLKATSRAKERGRHDRRPPPGEVPLPGLHAWLDAHVDCADSSEVQRLDLDAFLARTTEHPIESAERRDALLYDLRQAAEGELREELGPRFEELERRL